MRMKKVQYPIIGISLMMFVLAGCGVSPEQPPANPSAIPTEGRSSPTPETEMEIVTVVVTDMTCPCAACVNLEAWEDQNENGTWDRWEVPLGACRSPTCSFGFAILPGTPRIPSEADLREGSLSSVDLRDANLMGADLQRANLRQADLFGADLGNADLSGANLSKANVEGVSLKGANLSGADLTDADLSGSDLIAADLGGADLIRANLQRTDLHGARYDQGTKWPEGFDPITAGAILEEWDPDSTARPTGYRALCGTRCLPGQGGLHLKSLQMPQPPA